ncbi:unnamed protein product, partial [Urochloa humidicola]
LSCRTRWALKACSKPNQTSIARRGDADEQEQRRRPEPSLLSANQRPPAARPPCPPLRHSPPSSSSSSERLRLPPRVPSPASAATAAAAAVTGGRGEYIAMAGRLLANLLVMGGTIMGRAVLQAYRKAIVNANQTGAAQEVINGIKRASKAMTEQEARQILGISEKSTWEEIVQYDTMFERNAKNGSFYLQSKVHRAKECLEPLYQKPDVPN